MSRSLFSIAKLNAFSSLINFIVSSALTFFISPFLVSFLGTNTFGIWKICQKYLDFASIADGRSSQALKWIVAKKEGENSVLNNSIEKKQAVGSALLIWICFIPILLTIIGLLVYFLPFSIHDLKNEEFSVVRYTGVLLGLNILMGPLFGIPDAVLVGTNQAYKSTLIQTIWLVLANLAMLYVAYIGYGLICMALVMFIVACLKGITILIICRKNVDWFGILKPNKIQTKSFLGFSFWVLIWSFVSRILLSSEILLIGVLVGANYITNYVFSAYIVQLGIAVGMITSSAVLPGMGALLGKKDFIKVRSIVASIREVILVIAIIFGGLILAINNAFVTLWVGNEFFIGDVENVFLVIVMIQLIILRNEAQIQDITLNIRKKVLYGISGAFSGFTLGIIFYLFISKQIYTIFIGLFIGRLIISLVFPIMVNRFINKKNSFPFKYLLGIILLILSFYFQSFMISDNWGLFILKAISFASIYSIICFFVLLDQPNRRMILKRILK